VALEILARLSRRRVAEGALVLALGVLLVRFLFVAPASFSYDEATYADLAQHPWRSAYYPDAVFVRHPPLYFIVLGAWTLLAGASEVALRIPSLIASGAGVALTWDALRRLGGNRAAALGALLLGTSFLTLVYGLQATMYPLAFALASLGLWAHARGRERLERAALVLLALTHLFGFVFLAVRLWRRRTWRDEVPAASPAFLWLGAAGVANLLAPNPVGPAIGPAWQLLRVFALLYEGLVQEGALWAHLVVFLVALFLLNPAVLRSAWRERRRWSPWALGAALLLLSLLPGPGFLRYALLLAPVALVVGLPGLTRGVSARRSTAAVVAFALAAATLGAAYIASEIDPRAANDVPGAVDWRAAAGHVEQERPDVAVAPAPTALAHYLVHSHGFLVVDAQEGPGRLLLEGPDGRRLEVREATHPSRLPEAGRDGALLVVPEAWEEGLQRLLATGYAACGTVPGALIVRLGGCEPAAGPT
jgi:4-amino-4-deoxy-L-arabinose transferase-like glycosyltransferase